MGILFVYIHFFSMDVFFLKTNQNPSPPLLYLLYILNKTFAKLYLITLLLQDIILFLYFPLAFIITNIQQVFTSIIPRTKMIFVQNSQIPKSFVYPFIFGLNTSCSINTQIILKRAEANNGKFLVIFFDIIVIAMSIKCYPSKSLRLT